VVAVLVTTLVVVVVPELLVKPPLASAQTKVVLVEPELTLILRGQLQPHLE
jgi:hypothetical protein